jgi:uncharacterized integral membrane protein (TIGR00698 family)
MSQQDKGPEKPRRSAWEEALLGCKLREGTSLVPGVGLAVVLVVSAILITNMINHLLGLRSLVSYIMMAIIVGLLVANTVGVPRICQPGVRFCLVKLLRLGIILMGIRLSVFAAARIGAWGVPIVILSIASGLVVTILFTRWLKLPHRLGTLIAVGTSICGASAIVATGPGIKARDEEVAYAVANITVFGIAAMLLYPYLANVLFAGNAIMAGLFQGTAIHETAQVTGAGLIYDQAFHVVARPTAADVAIVIKLVRNVFMALVIPLVIFLYSRRGDESLSSRAQKVSIIKLVPLFIVGFVFMATLRSVGDAGIQSGSGAFGLWSLGQWQMMTESVARFSGYILATAMAGVGLGTNLAALRRLGIKPFYIGLISATIVGVVSIISVLVLGPHVRI